MSHRSTKRQSGYSLLEMTVSIALGSVVLAAAVQIYIQGVNATWTTTQRAELQQDFRAASNILTKDLSLAGAGLTPGAAIALPSTGVWLRPVGNVLYQRRFGGVSKTRFDGLPLRTAAGI